MNLVWSGVFSARLSRCVVGRTACEATDFLELAFLFLIERMRILSVDIKLRMSTAELVVGHGGDQVKILVEFIPDDAAGHEKALPD